MMEDYLEFLEMRPPRIGIDKNNPLRSARLICSEMDSRRNTFLNQSIDWIVTPVVRDVEKLFDKSKSSEVFYTIELLALGRPTHKVGGNEYKTMLELVDILDPDGKIRSKIGNEFWRDLQRIDPVDETRFKVCSHCARLDCTKKCSSCETSYCNRDCQVADWKTHKPLCKEKADRLNIDKEFKAKFPNYIPAARMEGGTSGRAHHFMEDGYKF